MTDLRLVIFDMDGTLIDSQRVILAAMRRAYDSIGAPVPGDEAVRRIIGLSLPQVFQVLSPEASEVENTALVEAYKSAFIAIRAETGGEAEAPMFPGARAALDRLAGRGYLLSVATGKARRGLDHAIEVHGLAGFFTFAQTADDARSKPHPEMVERAMALHGVGPDQTVMIGDTTFDIEMARAAGAGAIGVDWGYHPGAELLAAGAGALIEHYDDLDAAVEAAIGAP